MAISSLPLSAVDWDGDGMGDVWQDLYGITADQRGDDPDGDGYSNLFESIVGTNPFDATDPVESKTLEATDDGFRYDAMFTGNIGVLMFPGSSSDLRVWEALDPSVDPTYKFDFVENCTTSIVSKTIPRSLSGYFNWRVNQVEDRDGDGVNRFEEIILGTNDLSTDSDKDGITDAYELYLKINPLVAYDIDPLAKDIDFSEILAEDHDEDGLSFSEEMLAGFNPSKIDTDGDGLHDGSELRWNIITEHIDYEDLWVPSERTCEATVDLFSEEPAYEDLELDMNCAEFLSHIEGEWFSTFDRSVRVYDGGKVRSASVYQARQEAFGSPNNAFWSIAPFRALSRLINREVPPPPAGDGGVNRNFRVLRSRLFPVFGSDVSGELKILFVQREHLRQSDADESRPWNLARTESFTLPLEEGFGFDHSISDIFPGNNVFTEFLQHYYRGQWRNLPDPKGEYRLVDSRVVFASDGEVRNGSTNEPIEQVNSQEFGISRLLLGGSNVDPVALKVTHTSPEPVIWRIDGTIIASAETGQITRRDEGVFQSESSARIDPEAWIGASSITVEAFGEVIWEWRVRLGYDLDIEHPVTGLVSEKREDKAEDGALVAVYTDATTPITKLILREPKNKSMESLLEFKSEGRYRIWEDSELTREVISLETSIGTSGDRILYVQGISHSLLGQQEVVSRVSREKGGHAIRREDSVMFTVVESELLIVSRSFIPYAWVDIPHPFHLFEVAKGDSRSYDPELLGSYRTEQRIVITPYRDLHQRDLKMAVNNSVGVTEHYSDADVINHGFVAHSGIQEELTERPSFIDASSDPTRIGEASVANMKAEASVIQDENMAVVRLFGNADEPIVLLAAPIDWDFTISCDCRTPNAPRFSMSGSHDGFPSYEIYYINMDSEALPLFQWSPPLARGVTSLFDERDDEVIQGVDVK